HESPEEYVLASLVDPGERRDCVLSHGDRGIVDVVVARFVLLPRPAHASPGGDLDRRLPHELPARDGGGKRRESERGERTHALPTSSARPGFRIMSAPT